MTENNKTFENAEQNATPTAIDTINEKLNSAAEVIARANADAEQRREEEEKQRLAEEEENRLRREEAEKRRAEEEERIKAANKRRLDQLLQAENYRKTLAENKENAQKTPAKIKAEQKKAQLLREQQEAAERAQKENEEKEREEAAKRNAEADDLLSRLKERAKARQEAKDNEPKPEPKPKAEPKAAYEGGPIVITTEGMELLAGTKEEEPSLKFRNADDIKIEMPAKTLVEPMPKAEKPAAEPKPKREPKPKAKAPDDFIITIGGDDNPFPPEFYQKAEPKKAKKAAPAAAPAKVEDKPAQVEERNPESDALRDYLLGLGTLDRVQAKTDFGEEYLMPELPDEPEEAEGIEALTYEEEDNLPYAYAAGYVLEKGDFIRDKKNKKNKNAPEAIVVDAPAEVADAPTAEADENNDGKAAVAAIGAACAVGAGAALLAAAENADAPAEAAEAAAPVAEIAAPVAEAAAYEEPIPVSNEKLDALLEERNALADKLRQTEANNANELVALKNKEHEKHLLAIQAADAAKENKFREEIAGLEAQLQDKEREHSLKKAKLERSIESYELAAKDPEFNPTAEQIEKEYGEVLAENGKPSKKVNIAKTERAALGTLADDFIEQYNMGKASRRDLKKYLAKSRRYEEKLIKRAKKCKKKMRRKKGEAHILLLVEYLAIKRCLLESYTDDYRCALSVKHKKYSKKYEKLLCAEIKDHNENLSNFTALTNIATDRVPETLTSDIKAGVEIAPFPVAEYTKAAKPEKKKKLTRKEKKLMKKEEMRLLKEEKRAKKRGKGKDDAKSEFEKTVKADMKENLETVRARLEYRIERLSYLGSVRYYRFGEESGRDRRARRDNQAKIKAIKREKRKLLSLTKFYDEKYLEVALTDTETCRAKRRADRVRMKELRERILSLIMQRDEVNERLIALYRENNLDGKKKKKNVRKKLYAVRLRAVKKSFGQQKKMARKLKKYRVPLARKQDIYELMNRRTDLKAYLAECEYRLKREKPKGKAKRELKAEIKLTKRRIKYTERDTLKSMKRAHKRSVKTPSKLGILIWVLVLVALVGACVAAYMFWPQIMEFVNTTIAGFMQK